VRAAVAWLDKNQADILFLDIHLSDGNSFSIFEKIAVNTPIIFTTAYGEYAISAMINLSKSRIKVELNPKAKREVIVSSEFSQEFKQ